VYLHLGADVSVYEKDIIGIFDYKLTKNSSVRECISSARWRKNIVRLEGSPKCFVMTDTNLYIVPVSRATLVRRMEKDFF